MNNWTQSKCPSNLPEPGTGVGFRVNVNNNTMECSEITLDIIITVTNIYKLNNLNGNSKLQYGSILTILLKLIEE